MDIQKEDLGNAQVQLTVTVEPERVQQQKKAAARELAKGQRIPGFRPGKAPYHIIARTYGEGAILEKALDMLIPTLFEEAVKESETPVWSIRGVEPSVQSLDPLVVTFLIPTPPQITLGDVESLEVEYEEEEVTDEDVEEALAELRESRATWLPSVGAAEYGDLITLNLRGDLLDGTTVVDVQEFEAVLSERPREEGEEEAPASVIEVPGQSSQGSFPDINAQLRGMMPNQVKEFSLAYPADWQDARVANRTVLYKATMLDVKRKSLPTIDDELAQSLGDYENLAALREQIYQNLTQQAEAEADARLGDAVLDALVAASEVTFAPSLVGIEVEHRIEHLEERLRERGRTLDDYFAETGRTRESLEDEISEDAEKALRRSLVLSEYIRTRAIELTSEELTHAVLNFAAMVGGDRADELLGQLMNDQETISALANETMTRKAKLKLIAEMTGEPERPLFPPMPVADGEDEGEGDEADGFDPSRALAELASAMETAAEMAGLDGEEEDAEGDAGDATADEGATEAEAAPAAGEAQDETA